eukprot:Trichotokara_eunicae@DN3815_c0_g1_i2.p2
MKFTKRGILTQEVTETGVKNVEVEAQNEEKDKEDRLKQLPEFNRDRQLLSLAETSSNIDEEVNADEPVDHAPAPITQDDFEFLESVMEQKRFTEKRIEREEKEELQAFRQARQSLHVEKEEEEDDNDPMAARGGALLGRVAQRIAKKKKIEKTKVSLIPGYDDDES